MITQPQITHRFEGLFDLEMLDRRLCWEPYRANGRTGVDIVWLFDTRDSEPDGAAAAILRYRPGAIVPRHVHGGYEIVFVLDGVLVNDTGAHRRGTLEVYPPGSTHRLESPEGCIFLVVWEKPVAVVVDAPLPEFDAHTTPA
jgi:quercetin dioxygenase-like cupin family protein